MRTVVISNDPRVVVICGVGVVNSIAGRVNTGVENPKNFIAVNRFLDIQEKKIEKHSIENTTVVIVNDLNINGILRANSVVGVDVWAKDLIIVEIWV